MNTMIEKPTKAVSKAKRRARAADLAAARQTAGHNALG